ncbi:pantoate--beta-alanine ligase [Nitrosospira sp. NRS527]|uniref:pantoate--beta-alanine ligase n=1 Tax=Nitrosospira sp. NRS527 TaxID=155925 RepID=UPI001AF45010|nr:pantoate--beta-alanine ligase [Nitrosospira sp. NRS527]BCT67281.1 Pantothenate synthetase [Nitrosospira sp. NRS527]
MELVADISSLRARLRHKSSIAFVPTMGSLHEGHLSLVRLAQQEADFVVVSIFVNRLQFAPGEDFDRYPRALADDCELLENHGGANMVFAPGEKDLYPVPQQFMLEPPPVANILEGEFRPGFFRGVATVVLKLLNIVQPQTAIFGKKDYQQLHIMRELVRQLNLPVKIVAGETVRAPDNLASSSRNRYLTNEERVESARLYQVLLKVKQEIENGNRNFHGLEENAKKPLHEHHWKIDYISIRQRDTLAPACKEDENLVILGAARLGKTRLIDNLEISVKN